MTERTSKIDKARLAEVSRQALDALGGAVSSAMIYLGDRMGLYRAMAGAGALTSVELAKRTGLHERWVREWLYQQGASGFLTYCGDDRFRLSAEAEAVLADESHTAFAAGMFSSLPQTIRVAERLPESFRTGVGLDFDESLGAEGAISVERGFAAWYRTTFVSEALPKVEGVVEMLRRGATVADVGCGAGLALLEMAAAFPRSDFHGYDISSHALARAERNREVAHASNVAFHHVEEEPLPEDGRFDFVTTFDCLHDMTDPVGAMRAIRRSLASHGVWLVGEVAARDGYEANVEAIPLAPLLYGQSVLGCMSSALSESGGAGLGTLGLHEELARRMAIEAGFASFETLELGHPVNAFYVARP